MIIQEVKNKKIYLGDSVYVTFDGYGYILTTENGLKTDPSNKIYLDAYEIEKLNAFVAHINEER